MMKFLIRQSIKILILTAVIMMAADNAAGQDDNTREWKLAKEKNGIRVYTRLMKEGKFKEYKTDMLVDATPEELLNILLDVEAYTQWMAFVKEARILEEEYDKTFYVYSEVKVPWPFDNRDEITLSTINREPRSGTIEIKVKIVQGNLPEKEGVVRMSSGNGRWTFIPEGEAGTRVVHVFGGDPGGNIPAWIVNMFLVDGPYKTMLGLQERVKMIKVP